MAELFIYRMVKCCLLVCVSVYLCVYVCMFPWCPKSQPLHT